jgi:hypothetical protein
MLVLYKFVRCGSHSDVSTGHVASICRVEEEAKKETRMKQAESITGLLSASCWIFA